MKISSIEKPLRMLANDATPIPVINTPVDAIAYLIKLHLTINSAVAPFVLGRVWHANEVPKDPVWPFIVISNVKNKARTVTLTVEAWGRWTPESVAISEAVKRALPASFEHVTTTLQRPGNTSAGAAVAAMTFRKGASDAS